MSTPLTRSQIHILSREKTKTKALSLLKRYFLHCSQTSPFGKECQVIFRTNKRGKVRSVFVYNVPDGYMYIKRLNGEFRGKYRVYRTN